MYKMLLLRVYLGRLRSIAYIEASWMGVTLAPQNGKLNFKCFIKAQNASNITRNISCWLDIVDLDKMCCLMRKALKKLFLGDSSCTFCSFTPQHSAIPHCQSPTRSLRGISTGPSRIKLLFCARHGRPRCLIGTNLLAVSPARPNAGGILALQ